MLDPGVPSYWAAPALLAALIAALGYIGKLLVEFIREWRVVVRGRHARLAELLALLQAGDVAYQVQCELRDRLFLLLSKEDTQTENDTSGYDQVFSKAYPDMVREARELHSLIRAYTVYTLKPLNDDILDWLREDVHFRGLGPKNPRFGELSIYLQRLEAHLLLWRAKYKVWIPGHPDRCLVYLADEKRHGLGFPVGATQLLADLMGHQLPPPPNSRVNPTGVTSPMNSEHIS